ncbi:protein disulfide-isomerase domain [Cryptococcus neoformans C23]|uniref:Protein disulfide-isomerase domain n=2 Tax=Cryptococcus neoformans TaxID=5207 RepID=A0A854Q1R1_CRYNE|nr:protein disulfide-isomerase [Cryptococcus neoformans var. grubii H99]AUB29124.1 protein disulfide-isomerase [Cryptococcus neoformans var. grubii]OWZ26226.1 protein disulfide-isomerase domain [Cryptococcus neoformans var. grubii AD1-83a]OWZ26262.1 protein disulfide-isomerase domain [Cryptococcus neoformans var. grubii AD2-60a]OWZ38121.1 protein disulfide-isomerase domain [Cryptococcus neoformans var. grubii C23]OXC80989.1 protein disulfide-isomerase domain [Cryptococcus neoformans var. grubi|eukprot:XP_012053618.1 protein disulfide-isomerase [Cryptococcus neoformans var. grubii H99]
MRLPRLLSATFSLSALLTKATATTTDLDDDFQLRELTEDNFKSSVSQGVWLVEHFSPKCAHCRAFAPTWTQLARDKWHLERLTGFHMAQVNCLAQGDLCNSNGIKFYPQIIMYTDGKPSPHYTGGRSYEELSNYIDEHAHTYAETILDPAGQSKEALLIGPANLEGKVQEVDERGLDALKAEGPVLVEYFAPWCGHCKALRPTYEQLALELQGQLNVAAVNCDDHRALCISSGIKAYPTIRLLSHGTFAEYSGARSLAKLKEFSQRAEKPASLTSIKAGDFDRIVDANDAFFLYLQTFDTTVAEVDSVKKSLEPLLGTVPAYTSTDIALYQRLHVVNPPPTSTLFAFSSYSTRPVGTMALPASSNDLRKFVNLHRFPTLVRLDASNFQSLMRSDTRAIVVLAGVHKGEEGKKERDTFADIARAWKRGGRRFEQPVWFVWVEGETSRWANWLKRFYGIKKRDLPGVVVIDTPLEEYYDTTIEGTKIEFEGSSIFSVLEGFYQHFLRPKRIESTLEWGSRSASETLISIGETTVEHPFLSLSVLVGTVALFVYLLQKCLVKDPKDGYWPSRLD